MGKNLRGRELGEGIVQRKDGKYSARFTNRNGKRVEKYFDSVSEAQKWRTLAKLDDESNSKTAVEYRMTVDEWFKYWIKTFKKDLSPNTIRNYKDRYYSNIQQYILTCIRSVTRQG